MKSYKAILTSLLFALICSLCSSASAATLTQIYTSPTPPISMPAGVDGSGVAYKAVEEMMKRAHVGIPITFGEWDRVYNKVLNTNGTAIFPMVMTPERRNNFIWVGPIAGLDYFVYKPRGSNVKINDINDVRNVKSIAVVDGYAVIQTLKDAGCTNLKYYPTPEQALNALLNGDASIGIFPEASVKIFLKNMGVRHTDRLIPIHRFMKRNLYYGLNKNVSPRVALYMQDVLKSMEADGTLAKLYKEYMPGARQPKIPDYPVFPDTIIVPLKTTYTETLIINGTAVPTIKTNIIERRNLTPPTTQTTIVTKESEVFNDGSTIITEKETVVFPGPQPLTIYAENFPPFTFNRGNSSFVQGAVAELVAAIQKELSQIPTPIILSEWNSIYVTATTTPNTIICVIKKTPERENEFYWIGPYAADSTWLYARQDSLLHITNFADAKAIPAIACVGGAFANAVLSELGFNNIIPYSTPTEAVYDMMNNPGHAAAFSAVTAPYILRDAGFSAVNIKPLIQISNKTNYYIGISKSTSPNIAMQWQNAFEALRRRGVVQEIMQRWVH